MGSRCRIISSLLKLVQAMRILPVRADATLEYTSLFARPSETKTLPLRIFKECEVFFLAVALQLQR